MQDADAWGFFSFLVAVISVAMDLNGSVTCTEMAHKQAHVTAGLTI